jgi:hypothetical protein
MRNYRVLNQDGQTIQTCSSGSFRGVQEAEVILRPGDTYLVEPENPQNLHHRGRLCIFLGIDSGDTGKLRVRFEDTGRQGRVEMDDLVLPR